MDQSLAELAKELRKLREDVDSIILPQDLIGLILNNPSEYAEDFAERTIVKFIPEFIKAKKLGEKFAKKLTNED